MSTSDLDASDNNDYIQILPAEYIPDAPPLPIPHVPLPPHPAPPLPIPHLVPIPPASVVDPPNNTKNLAVLPEPDTCHMSHARAPPRRLEPDNYGKYGRLKEEYKNAEDQASFAEVLNNIIREAHEDIDWSLLTDDNDASDNPTLCQALDGIEAEDWDAAIRDKLNSFKEADVYELVDPDTVEIENLIGNKLILSKKRGALGQLLKFKACCVALGNTQREGVDYVETFAPVVKAVSLRVFHAIVALLGMRI